MDDFNGENNIWLFFIAIFSFIVVGIAIVMQHFYNYQPCAWCVLQRFIFLIIGIISFIGFVFKVNVFTPIITFIIACIGQVVAGYQFFIASKSFDCNLSIAEKFITQLSLDKLLPGMFEIRALCADASLPLWGINFEIWSFTAFFLLSLFSMPAFIYRYRYY